MKPKGNTAVANCMPCMLRSMMLRLVQLLLLQVYCAHL
jgi:hypothetical protein